MNLLANLRDKGIIGSALFITHDLSILYQVADRILIMYAGQFVEIGPTDRIINNPKHPYAKALIASLPKVGIQHSDKKLEGIKGTPPDLLNIGSGCRFRFRCQYQTGKCEEAPIREEISDEHSIACWNFKELESGKNG